MVAIENMKIKESELAMESAKKEGKMMTSNYFKEKQNKIYIYIYSNVTVGLESL